MIPAALITLIVGLFLLGLGIGYIYSRDSEASTASRTRTALAVLVTIVWTFAVAADVLVTGYTVSPLIHAIMGAVVGYFFADNGLNINIGG